MMSQDRNPEGSSKGRSEYPKIQEWVRRLVSAQGLNWGEKQLGWWTFHLESFLRYCRKQGDRVEARILARSYYDSLAETEGGKKSYRVDQTKQALTVFIRGTENWHWEEEEGYGWRPRFRIKSKIEGGSDKPPEAGLADRSG